MRQFSIATAVAVTALSAIMVLSDVTPSHAQGRPGGRDGGQQDEEKDAAKRKKRDEEWGNQLSPLPGMRNAGPCPYVKVLYDASRMVEFKDNREASNAVIYSGEIQGISAGCKYRGADPIELRMEVLFALGRGPEATPVTVCVQGFHLLGGGDQSQQDGSGQGVFHRSGPVRRR